MVLDKMLYIFVLLWILIIIFRSKFFLHMIQLEGYKNEEYKRWIKTSPKAYPKKIKKSLIILTAVLLLYIIFIKSNILLYIYIGLWVLLTLGTLDFKKEEPKKKLEFTPRAKRLYISSLLVNILQLLILFIIIKILFPNGKTSITIILYGLFIINFLQGRNMILANAIVNPIEKRINTYYYTMAQEKIKSMDDLDTVGITGSFGKTSTKFIVDTILKEKYRVLKTPESYNTPMGISKVINSKLTNDYEIFIAEMGARYIGDIKEIAKLVHPKIGVITSIGPAHLETFKNIENIMKTKYELIEELPSDGIAIFNYDNKYLRKLADKTFKEKILYGLENQEKLDIYATDIEVSELGSSFILKDKSGEEIKCTTKLLGKHNIYNILAGASVAKALGLTFEEIRRGIAKIEPIPHRLNIINPGTGVIVIDDTFNSNPVGVKAALEVLNQFKEGRKIIITPGMVELGDKEEESNREFGVRMSTVCDYVILVGKNRTKPIYKGLKESGYNENNIIVVQNLDEATKEFQKIVRPKDVVLFENDLPDNYEE
ncbi:UDP-N-acetylmuramoyl-tripeptide--D-alanyl-D-alanine ligase [Anaerosalibacter bizertensis]|nr:UDP-N-acetylmuramoyl-tripeptide--D-alanyl-D-alanine ligase [Anaerosalibacter bizertensis]